MPIFPCLRIKQHAFPIQLSKQKQNNSSGEKAVWSINHSQGAEILCKVFGDDSWLVGAAERELGFCERCGVVTPLSSATCAYVDRCFCLCVCVWGAAWQVRKLLLPACTLGIRVCVHLKHAGFAWLHDAGFRQPDAV